MIVKEYFKCSCCNQMKLKDLYHGHFCPKCGKICLDCWKECITKFKYNSCIRYIPPLTKWEDLSIM
jgi:hypothetical protein